MPSEDPRNTLPKSFLDLSARVRPQILKLARQNRLVDEAFKAYRLKAYPDANDDQIAAMRNSFFAGACELLNLMEFAADVSTMDATQSDLDMMEGIGTEIELAYKRVLMTANAAKDRPQ